MQLNKLRFSTNTSLKLKMTVFLTLSIEHRLRVVSDHVAVLKPWCANKSCQCFRAGSISLGHLSNAATGKCINSQHTYS